MMYILILSFSFIFNNTEYSYHWWLVKDDRKLVVSKCKSSPSLIICLKAIKESHKEIPTNGDSPQLVYLCEEFVWK